MRVNRGNMTGMHKRPEERKSYHLRVSLTSVQRALSEEAVWARGILVSVVKQTIANKQRSGHPVHQAPRQPLCRWTCRSRAALRIALQVCE